VMLTKAGTKLLDFGLAKLAEHENGTGVGFGDGATRTSPLTSQGAILGTLHYMSPEQLEGREVDARSDIHAFGAVLFEMLCGRRAFEGQSQAGIIAAIIGADPPSLTTLADVRTTLPIVAERALDRLIAKCLAKNPDDRWQSAADLAAELQWINEERLRAVSGPASPLSSAAPVADPRAKTRERIWMGVAAFAIVALASVAYFWYPRPTPPPEQISFTIGPPEGQTISGGPGLMSLSPDGRRLAVVADPDGERLAEVPLVAERREVELQRLGLEAELLRLVLDRRDVEVRLAGDRADRGELVARHLHVGDSRVGERLQPGVVLRAGVAERDELRQRLLAHTSYCTPR